MTEQHTNDTPIQATAVDMEATLRGIGLAPVKAWVPGPATKTSATAKRTKKARDKAAENGLKQLSITLPVTLHPLARELAARTKAGEPASQVLDDLRVRVDEVSIEASSAAPVTITPTSASAPSPEEASIPTPVPGSAAVFVGLSAWRCWLISLILPAESRTLLGLRRGGA